MILQALEKVKVICYRLKPSQSHQKSYAYEKYRDFEFNDGDCVLLKVSPMKGVMLFSKKGKLGPRYVVPIWFFRKLVMLPMSWNCLIVRAPSIRYFMCPCCKNV